MAAARDNDISLWLHNKLGTSSDTWSEGSICAQLNVDVLRNIKECFVELQTQVKLKLLLSFFHIPKRNVEEWRAELEEILEVAVVDSEPWVAMLAEIMRTCPSTGHLNLEIREPPENQRITHDLITELRKLVKKHSELGLLPMECNYLNRNAFMAAAGSQAPLTKHFALKRKPKAAALRAELLNRSADAQANVKKSQLPTVPVRSRGIPRKMNDTTPLKGIPSRLPGSGLRGSGLGSTPLTRPLARSSMTRKDGGIKLVEITESPITAQMSKKRRKAQEASDAKASEAEDKRREQQQQQQAAAAQQQQQQQQQTVVVVEGAAVAAAGGGGKQGGQAAQQVTVSAAAAATPDYAAGLTPSNPPTPGPPATPTTPLLAATPPGSVTTTTIHANAVVGTITSRSALQSTSAAAGGGRASTPTAAATTTQRIIVTPSSSQATGSPTLVYRTVTPVFTAAEVVPAPAAIAATSVAEAPPTPSGQPQYATLQPLQPELVYTTPALPAASTITQGTTQQAAEQTQQISQQVITVTPAQAEAQQPQQQQQQQAAPLAQTGNAVSSQQQQQQQQKRGLSLTREQMLEAQEMFRTSNKVTRPEKALILGFMAGSRENPCPHLGNIVTIKLSEGEETVTQPDGPVLTMLAETHFQMNYNTGEWKRIKKYRPLPTE
ncbi:negative elongation factor A-like [Eriocheir sinensis]|uniref:negative elongation factor A-like n=1 Tax=Eriocheir sinensis TaxID=95602 RepID=UPI0021C6FB7D|nr:negative elongation factor A-like [Eriocheir sinensis]